MKNKILLTILAITIFSAAKAQWSLTGNSTTAPNNVLGTTNATDLDIRTGNTNRMYIRNSNGFVGIGTTNPVYILDIVNSGNATMSFKSNTGHALILVDRGSSSSSAAVNYRTAGAPNWQTGNLLNNDFTINNIGLNPSITILKTNNNVGIGTITPTFKLDVTGTGRFTSTLRVGAYTLPATDGTSGQVLKTNGTGTLTWSTDNNSGGTVTGITAGTGLSGGTITASGTISAQNTTALWNANQLQGRSVTSTLPTTGQVLKYDGTNWKPDADNSTTYTAGTGISFAGSIINSVWTASGNNIYNNNTADIGIGTSVPATKLHVNGGTRFDGNVWVDGANTNTGTTVNTLRFGDFSSTAECIGSRRTPGAGQNQNGLDFYTNGLNRMAITNNGNIGINTKAPGTMLSLRGGSLSFHDTNISNNVPYVGIDYDVPTDGMRFMANISNTFLNTTNMFISRTSGNVGIGTTQPTGKLDIKSNSTGISPQLTAYEDDSTDYARIRMKNTSLNGNYHWDIGARNNATLANERFTIYNSKAGSDLMTITGSGNVGIGTNNPSAKLAFNNNTGNKISFYNNGGVNHYGIGLDANLLQFYTEASSNDIAFGYGNSSAFFERMRIKGSGNVGIGTNSPSSKLEIRDGALGLSSATKRWELAYDNTNSYFYIDEFGANRRLVIANGGNVGIGTATPDYKLDVCGTIRASEVRVEVFGCDYVFDKDYKLRSIEELEQFINTNNHLPGVVSASEVEKDGWKLGEMNKAMLEKIEELTLYVIQLNKDNIVLRNELKSLRK